MQTSDMAFSAISAFGNDTADPFPGAAEVPKSESKLRVALLAPDGVGIRNFVLGRYLQQHVGHLTVLHGCPGEVPARVLDHAGPDVAWKRMSSLKDRPIGYTLRQTLTYAHLYWGDTRAMRFTRTRPQGGSWKTRSATTAAKLAGRALAFPAGINLLERSYFRSVASQPEVSYYRKIFEEIQPSVVFGCNHRAPNMLPAVLAAKALHIPTVAFIASWDNLTSKSRLAAEFDHHLVWSDNMRRELLHFYPRVSPEQVTVVGTPQFDCYTDPAIQMTRREFFQSIGADPSRQLICYSGGDVGNCPQDPEHLEIVMKFIRSGVIRGNPQVVVRPAPVDDGARYAPVCERYPEILFRQPAWEHLDLGDWSRCIPMPEDVAFLANLTRHCDLNINNASTMTLDFGMHDRPVVNLSFDVGRVLPGRLPLWDYYNWEHYRPIVDLGAARFARNEQQLAEHINFYLDHPDADREGRQALFQLQVNGMMGNAGARIGEALEAVASA